MRVLILNWKDVRHPAAGGAEVYTWEVARRLVAAGHRVCWFASRPSGLASMDRYDGLEVVRVGGRLGVYGEARRFWEAEGHRFDLVIDEVNTRPFLASRYVGNVPVVALIHQVCREVWFRELSWPAAAAGRYLLEPYWLAAYRDVPTLTVSLSSAQSLAAYGVRRLMNIGEGISLPPDLPSLPKEDLPTVLYVGRLAPNKRPNHVLEAMRQVWRHTPQARCWIVGAGPMENWLLRRARRVLADARLPSDRVVFWGRVPELLKFELLTRAWVLAVPSVREGWALVVDEAAACGTPSVGYRVAGLRDSIPGAGGTLTQADSHALGVALTSRLEALAAFAGERVPGWPGGAVSWDEVTARLTDAVWAMTRVPLTAAQLMDTHPGSTMLLRQSA